MMRASDSQISPKVDNSDDDAHHCKNYDEKENRVRARGRILKQCELLIDQERDGGPLSSAHDLYGDEVPHYQRDYEYRSDRNSWFAQWEDNFSDDPPF